MRLVAVTGASNVTGEIWPYPEIVALAHRHGARVLLDAAQLAPHRPVDMTTSGGDYLVLSGHKRYAPSRPCASASRDPPIGPLAPDASSGAPGDPRALSSPDRS